MANRYIPFGYEIVDAQVVIIEREAEVVRNVFSLYVQGNSLKTISERLNMMPISYAGDDRKWDKNMVKRMLENKKYIGDKDYPVIIPPETAELALKCKDKKCAEISENDKIKLDMYRAKACCAICGAKMKRSHAGSGERRRIYWQCTNAECDGNRHLFREKILDNMLLELLNELTDNLANIDYAEDREYEKNIEVIRLTNEMNELIQKPDTDSGEVIDKIMELASAKFNICEAGDNSAITEKIKSELAILPKQTTVDGRAADKVIKSIKMHPHKHIWVQLINGKVFEKKESIL